MKRQTKIIATILSLLLLVTACIGIAISAEGDEKELNVISQNVEYSDNLHLYYAVYPENVDVNGLVLNVYAENPDNNDQAELLATVANHEEVVLTGAGGETYTCRAFKTPGVALKNMATKFYVQAVATDGTKSPVRSYSVVEYFNEMIFNAEDEADVAAYEKMLAAGDAAQYLLDYYPNEDKNDVPTNYRYVNVADGIVAGGAKKGVYLAGEEITLSYTGSEYIDKWNLFNKDGELVATVNAGDSFEVSESVLCVPHTNRASGIYVDDPMTYNYADNTPVWSLTTQNGETVDNAKLYAEIVDNGNDKALVIANSDYANEAYVNIPRTYDFGDTYSFETDFKINDDIVSCSTGRSNKAIFNIYYGGTTFINWAFDSITVVLDKTDPENPVYKLTGNGLDYTFAPNTWNNLRVDFEDVTLSERSIKYYINGELVGSYTKTSASTNTISQLRVVMPQDSLGTLYLDNTFFGTVGNVGSRGEGSFASNENALGYEDITDDEFASSGKFVVTNLTSGTAEGKMAATIKYVNGDAALNISNDVTANQAYYNIKSDKLGKKYIFETDIMFDAASSSRSDNAFLQFYSSNSSAGSSTFWGGMPSASLTAVTTDGVTAYSFKCVDGEKTVTPGEWYNIRYEFDDWTTVGSEIRVYINGDLICTATNTKTTTAFYYIRLWAPPTSTAQIYLDNTFFSAVTAE